MSTTLLMTTVLFITFYVIWKIISVYHETKKANASLVQLKEKNQTRSDTLLPTREIGDLKIDDVHSLFKFKGQLQIFSFSELLTFELVLNNKKINLSKGTQQMLTHLDDTTIVNSLDLVFYVDGLNEGKYSYQFLYKPLAPQSSDFISLSSTVNEVVVAFVAIKEQTV